MKSDDEKLKELFQVREKPTFNSVIRRAKTLSVIRNVIVSLMIFIIVSFILLVSNASILNKLSNKKKDSLRSWFSIAMPNAYIGNIQIDDRIMIGEIDYVRYRFLGKKPVTDGSYKEGYTYMPLINGIYGDIGYYLFNSTGQSAKDLQEKIEYSKTGKQVMKFYHPSVKYESYINDLEKLDEISGSKLLEVSLSFDKGYGLDKVKNMIPDDITLNWYWVDTLTEKGKKDSSKFIFDEYDVYGIKALDEQGNSIENPEKEFIDTIMMCKEKKDSSNIYESLYNTLKDGKGEINKEDLKVIGVVVSGNVEALKALKDKNYIKAANIGAVTDKY